MIQKAKQLDKEQLLNWRPITLTNTDYKILAKVMAERLGRMIDKLISEDQVGYIVILEQVKDAMHFREKRMLSLEEIQTSTGQNIANTIFQYNALMNAIPRPRLEWVQRLTGQTDSDQRQSCEASRYNTKP